MSTAKGRQPPARGVRQKMAGLHTWTGLLAGWLLYAMFLTGTVSYFKEEISQWMRPELRPAQVAPDLPAIAQRTADTLALIAAGSPGWSMLLPTARSPVVSAFWRDRDHPDQPRRHGDRRFQTALFDPDTGKTLSARDTLGGEFFYRFHFQFYGLPVLWGRWLAGLCAMFMLVAIISGVIVHKKIFIDFFTFRWGKGQRSWLDAHNALSVFGLPFHFMITYSGLILLMALYMPWGAEAGLRTPMQQAALDAQLSAYIRPGQPAHVAAPLAPLDAMVRLARQRWGSAEGLRITVTRPGDAAARVAVARGDTRRVSTSPHYLLFDGVTGALLQVHDHVGAAAETRGVMAALHLGRFSDMPLRWLYFLISLGGTAMVGTGLVMWTVKRRPSLADPLQPHFGFRLVERLNISSIAGLSIAMTSYLWSNRLLPVAMAQRADTEVKVFFAAWGLSLLYAICRPARRAWIELLWTASALLALLPLLNAITTNRPLWHSLIIGDRVFTGFDLSLWAFAALHAMLAGRAGRPSSRATGRTAAPAHTSPAGQP